MGALSQYGIQQQIFLNAPDHINNQVLAVAGTAETITIPAGADYVLLAGTADFFARWDGGTAAVPAADVADGTGSELNPVGRHIRGKTISVVSATAGAIITASFWKGADRV